MTEIIQTPTTTTASTSVLTAEDILSLMEELKDNEGLSLASTTNTWTIYPKTYAQLRYWQQFPLPSRKLRKCQERRIQARKRAWRKHQARLMRFTYFDDPAHYFDLAEMFDRKIGE